MELCLKNNLSKEEQDRLIEETLENTREYLNPGFVRFKRSAKAKGVEWEGDGAVMRGVHGHEFIDCLGGYGVFALGHRPKEVVDAVMLVYQRIGLYSQELLNPVQGALARKLAELSPGDLKYTYFHCGGGESNDAAIKAARIATGRTKHITAHKSFHGKTMGALSATNREAIRKPFEPLVPGFIDVPYNDLGELEEVMSEEIASVILEPIQGEGGINVPYDDYFAGVRALCDNYGALLHVDEVQTGFGRTGYMFAMEHYKGVVPDIMTLGKAMGGGVMPISAVHGTAKVWKRLEENPWYLTNTFAGSAPACAAAIKTIEILLRDDLPKQSREKGEYFKRNLSEMWHEHPGVIRDVRGRGLFIGVEFHEAEVGLAVANALFEKDVLVANTINNPRAIRIEPPLVISREQIDTVLTKFRDALKDVSQKSP